MKPAQNRGQRIVGIVTLVTMPKLFPPPLRARKRSVCEVEEAVIIVPEARMRV